MSESVIEAKEIASPKVEARDILSGEFKVHWTPIEKLQKILKTGIYSSSFATRVNDSDYLSQFTPPTGHDDKFVYVAPLNPAWPRGEIDKVVGVVVDAAPSGYTEFTANLRITPRQFIGLVLVDKVPPRQIDFYNNRMEILLERAKNAIKLLRKKSFIERQVKEFEAVNHLPIYGTSGDMYWPRRMNHEEIVEELRRRNEVQ